MSDNRKVQKRSVLTKKSIAESIGESMAYFWSSFIGIGIANTFFMKCMYWLVLTILLKSIVNNIDID